MKRLLFVLLDLLAMLVLVSGVVAQEKKVEASPTQTAEQPKVEKPKAARIMKASGIVVTYEMGKAIKVKGKNKEMAYDITADTKVKGEVKEGARVTVTYKKEGEKRMATSISSTPATPKPKTEKMEKKAGETK